MSQAGISKVSTFDKVGNFADNQPYPLLVALQLILQVSSEGRFLSQVGKKHQKRKLSALVWALQCVPLCFYVATQRQKCGECCRTVQVIMKQ